MPDARALRKTMTDAEQRLWAVLRNRQLDRCKFRRQHPVGVYILDFACIERKLAIEVDGGQHFDNESDRQRTAWLATQGWRVIRFWNNDVLSNIDSVALRIKEALQK